MRRINDDKSNLKEINLTQSAFFFTIMNEGTFLSDEKRERLLLPCIASYQFNKSERILRLCIIDEIADFSSSYIVVSHLITMLPTVSILICFIASITTSTLGFCLPRGKSYYMSAECLNCSPMPKSRVSC